MSELYHQGRRDLVETCLVGIVMYDALITFVKYTTHCEHVSPPKYTVTNRQHISLVSLFYN